MIFWEQKYNMWKACFELTRDIIVTQRFTRTYFSRGFFYNLRLHYRVCMSIIELSSVQSSEKSSAKNWNWNQLWEATKPAVRTESVDTFGESQHDLFVTHQWQKMDELFLKCPRRAAKTLLMDLYLSFVFVPKK